MLNISICDDESNILVSVKKILEQRKEKIKINLYQDYKDLLIDIQKKDFMIDLLISDIQMKENGIDISKKILLYKPNLPIIFMSGYSQYMEEIFQVQPIYFLQKPITEERLNLAVDKAIKIVNKRRRMFSFESNGNIIKFESSDIYYIESKGRKLYFYGRGEDKSIYLKMNDLEEKLSENFIRIHQSYIINSDYLENFSKNGVVLKTKHVIPVSAKKYQSARMEIIEYLQSEDILD